MNYSKEYHPKNTVAMQRKPKTQQYHICFYTVRWGGIRYLKKVNEFSKIV